MKSVPVRIFFWLLLTLYVVGSGWWIVSVPHDPEELWRAIPGQAILVSRHDQLAQRLPELNNHPVVNSLVSIFGSDTDEWNDLQRDPGFRTIMHLIGQRELVMAFVPYLNHDRNGAWVLASWIGGQSQRLRWSHRALNLPGLESRGTVGNWPVWTWRWDTDEGPQQIGLALVDGMLIATTARDRASMQMIVDSYNGVFPSLATRRDLVPWRERFQRSTYQDRVLYLQSTGSGYRYWLSEFALRSDNRLDGVVVTQRPEDLPAYPLTSDIAGISEFWREAPIAAGMLGVEPVVNFLAPFTNQIPIGLVKEFILDSRAEAVALALFGGEYSGRIKGIKVPTLMAALYLPDGIELSDRLPALVDGWNARLKMGLVPSVMTVEGVTVWRMEATAGGLYGALAPPEQVALVASGDWVVISSNLKGLESLIRMNATGRSTTPEWAARMQQSAQRAGLGYFGLNLTSGAEALRLAITAYSLKVMFENPLEAKAQREKLNEAKAWLEVLARLGHLHLDAATEDDFLRFQVQTVP